MLDTNVPSHHEDPQFFIMGNNRFGDPMRIPVSNGMLSRHLLLLGGIGTGKSNAFNFLIRNVRGGLTEKDVVIIFDAKGDFYHKFYRPGDIVISNDERADGGNGPDYWNLFGEITVDDRLEENILEISRSLFSEKLSNTTQPFFPNAAKDIFAALLLHMVRSENLQQSRNNRDLRAILDSFSVPSMKKILQAVREVFVGNFRKAGTLSMRQLVRQKGGTVIFVEYDLGIGGVLTPIYRLLIDLAIKEALCRTKDDGNVYFFIDEFRLLPHLEHIDDGVNFGRSLGAKFFFGIQNIEQIAASYGQEMAHSILSGFGTTIAFRVNDAGSREYIKNLFGRNIKLQTYLSAVQNRGVSEQSREGYVVEDSDLLNLPVGQAIVGIGGCQPFRFQFKEYV